MATTSRKREEAEKNSRKGALSQANHQFYDRLKGWPIIKPQFPITTSDRNWAARGQEIPNPFAPEYPYSQSYQTHAISWPLSQHIQFGTADSTTGKRSRPVRLSFLERKQIQQKQIQLVPSRSRARGRVRLRYLRATAGVRTAPLLHQNFCSRSVILSQRWLARTSNHFYVPAHIRRRGWG